MVTGTLDLGTGEFYPDSCKGEDMSLGPEDETAKEAARGSLDSLKKERDVRISQSRGIGGMRTLSQLNAAIAKQEEEAGEETLPEAQEIKPKQSRSLLQDQSDALLDATLSRTPLHDRAYFLAYGFMSYVMEHEENPKDVDMLAELIRQEVLR